MKFMIKALGWTRWREEYDRELTGCRLRGEVPTLEIDPPAAESKPDWTPDAVAVGRSTIATRVDGRRRRRARASRRSSCRVLNSRRRGVRAVARDERAAAEAVRLRDGDRDDAARRSDERADARARRAGARVRRRHGPRHAGSESRVPVGERRPTCGSSTAGSRPRASGWPEAGTIADVTSCPGAESCRLAVTQSRGLGRLLEEHLRARPDLIAAADGARIKISGCPNGCGQHHIATIGFQGSVRRLGGARRAAVLRDGRRRHERAAARSFGRLAAKIPARRIPEAVERLIDLYAREKQAGESATGVFRPRRASSGSSATLADLERLTAADARAGRLRRSGRSRRVRAGGHGRGVLGIVEWVMGYRGSAVRPRSSNVDTRSLVVAIRSTGRLI